MKPGQLLVRCMSWQESGMWVAVCIDFALAAQGASMSEARQRLDAQVRIYVQEAFTVHSEHADVLLSRRAPMFDRLRFAFWSMIQNRPRLRRSVGEALRRLGVAISVKKPYGAPLPLSVAG